MRKAIVIPLSLDMELLKAIERAKADRLDSTRSGTLKYLLIRSLKDLGYLQGQKQGLD